MRAAGWAWWRAASMKNCPSALMGRSEPRSNLSARERASQRWKRTTHWMSPVALVVLGLCGRRPPSRRWFSRRPGFGTGAGTACGACRIDRRHYRLRPPPHWCRRHFTLMLRRKAPVMPLLVVYSCLRRGGADGSLDDPASAGTQSLEEFSNAQRPDATAPATFLTTS